MILPRQMLNADRLQAPGMLKPLRRLIRRGLELTGLIGPYYRFVERRLARAPVEAVDDGRPMPPADLLVAVTGGAEQESFSERGRVLVPAPWAISGPG